jgi:hypothetical protein
MVERTLAGMAAAAVTIGVAGAAVIRQPRLDIAIDGEFRESALIDVVSSPQGWIGARAVWEPAHIREIVLSRIAHGEIGVCSVGGMLFPDAAGSGQGAHIIMGEGRRVLAPLAPGIMRELTVSSASLLQPGDIVRLQPRAGTIALDGEREIEVLRDGCEITVTFNPQGPRVVQISEAIAAATRAGLFSRP